MTLVRTRNDGGAVAIIVALSCVLLFGVAALAVDLSNAFVRKRDVQAQADFAALAGAPHITGSNTKVATDPAVIEVANYLTKNRPLDDKVTGPYPTVTPGQLIDGNDANGEVYFLANYQMRVVSPAAQVNYGFAGVAGTTKKDVQASAIVGLRSPGKPVPFFLPKDCAAGTVVLKASSYNPGAPTFNPPSGSGNSIAKINSLNTTTVVGQAPTTLTIFGENFNDTPKVDFFLEGPGDRVPSALTDAHPATRTVDGSPDEATTTLPPQVYNTPGTWYMRIHNGVDWSRDVGIFKVGNPIPPPTGCGQRATGDFGVVDSPRTRGPVITTNLAEATALNMAIGIDHQILPWTTTPPQPPVQDTCQGNGGTPPSGANNDKAPSTDGRNCLNVLNGMNTDTVTDGMITGVSGKPGRLSTGSSICNKAGSTAPTDRLGHPTNDDVLSCFLKPGVTVADVSGETILPAAEESISSRIFDSPRFMVVPMIDYPVNPQNGFYPVVSMMPVFITDEPGASAKGSSYASTANGVTIQSTKVVSLTVVAINPLALPKTADNNGKTVPYLGTGTKVIALTD